VNFALPDSVTSALDGKSVLVTGSGGFLGSHLCDAIEALRVDCLGLDIRSGDEGCDVTAADFVHSFRKAQPYDYILHAAGIASPWHYRRNPLGALRASAEGTENVLRLAELWGARVLFFSSSEIYGDPTEVPTSESYLGALDTMGDRAPYDEGKRVGETLCSIYARKGVQAVVVRLFNAYGPGMSDDDRRFMPNLRRAKRLGEPLRIYGTGRQTRTFCYVTDTVRGCLQALVAGRPGVAYNIGNDKPEVSMLAVAEMAGVKVEVIEPPDDWPSGGDPNRRCPDIRRARYELGYEPAVKLEDGLREFLKS